MSGPFGSSQWMYSSGAGAFYPYEIGQSLRVNDDDNPWMERTYASSGSRTTWTWSAWIKLCDLATGFNGGLVGAGNIVSGADDAVNYRDNAFDFYVNGAISGRLITAPLLRDPSAWYHVVVVWDTTNATSSDRMRIYVNGERQAVSSSSDPALNTNSLINSNLTTQYLLLGYLQRFDGYMAEVNFIDGQALDPTAFAEVKSGVWIPKDPSGLTYGSNGYRLSFANSSLIGDDTSGNNNDWSPVSLAATDVVLDSPTNNFSTFNPNDDWVNTVLSEGNLKVGTAATYGITKSTFWVTSGKWYVEMAVTAATSGYYPSIGVANTTNTGGTAGTSGDFGVSYVATGQKFVGSSFLSYGASFTTGDVIAAALDMDSATKTITFYKNNVSQGTLTLTGSDQYHFGVTTQGADSCVYNFGQDSSFAGNKTAQGNTDANGIGDFYYAPPSGYLALCTANLPDPAIDPAQDESPADYFNVVAYSGNSSTNNIDVGFQPDWFWIKSRTAPQANRLYDAVRGVDQVLFSNLTNAEYDGSVSDPTSVYSSGVTLNNGLNVFSYNSTGENYVMWNWLAGNGTSSNTDGSITSTVSVNQKAGFSIVGYDSNPSGTVGHGLGQTPKLIIEKKRDATSDWLVGHTLVDGSYDYMRFNTTAANANAAVAAPTSTVFTPNATGDSMIAYCFAEVEGFSKLNKYSGNGSTDGPFAYCGFRPAFVMIKRADSTGNWAILDAARSPYNDVDDFLYANLSTAELANTTADVDFLSNGFKIRNTTSDNNTNGGTYIFMAFAENPFKYANAR
jgi:hypothetical protein